LKLTSPGLFSLNKLYSKLITNVQGVSLNVRTVWRRSKLVYFLRGNHLQTNSFGTTMW